VGSRRQVGVVELDCGWQLDVEVAGGIEPGPQAGAARAEYVAAAAAIGADEMQVVAGHLDPLDVSGEAEAEHRPLDVGELENVLVGDDLGQWPVGRILRRHRTSADELEVAVEADRAGGGTGGDKPVHPCQQLLVLQPLLDLPLDRGLEPGDDGERGARGWRNRLHVAVDVSPEELAVEGDHLAVETVQRPQPEVAVLGQLGEAEVSVEGTIEQSTDRRGLKEDVRLALGVEIGVPHRLHMQRSDPTLVEHAGSLPRVRLPPVSGGFKRSGLFGIVGVLAVAAIVAVIALTMGQGEANPKLALGLIFATIALFCLVLFALQRSDLERAAGTSIRASERAAAEGGRSIENPTTLGEPQLWAALAVKPIDAEAVRARSEMWDSSRRSLRLATIVTLLIFLTVPAIYLLESFVPLLIGGPLIVIAALYGSFRALAPGGELDRGYDLAETAMAPLGLAVTARPQVKIEMRDPVQGRMGPKIRGEVVMSGARHGRAVSVRLGSGEISSRSEVSLRTPAPAFKAKARDGRVRAGKDAPTAIADALAAVPNSTRWKGVQAEGGPEGIVVSRKGGAQSDWLCDLWLAERLAATL